MAAETLSVSVSGDTSVIAGGEVALDEAKWWVSSLLISSEPDFCDHVRLDRVESRCCLAAFTVVWVHFPENMD